MAATATWTRPSHVEHHRTQHNNQHVVEQHKDGLEHLPDAHRRRRPQPKLQ
jgi:hypothetical protein